MTQQTIAERLRHQCATLRTKPTPLADLIPLLQEAADALSAQQAAQPVPPECDVRRIMVDVVPGEDGGGHEVYAKNVTEVEDVLTRQAERIEELEMKVAAQPVAGEPVAFDAEGFRAWVAKNLPDDTIIGSSAWWADHLTAWAQRFAAPAPVGLVPLTPSEKRRMWHAATDLHRAVSHFESYCQGIEDGEAHHGIKAGKDVAK